MAVEFDQPTTSSDEAAIVCSRCLVAPPPLQNRAANAGSSRLYGSGGQRLKQIAFRADDADLAIRHLDALGERAEMVAAIAAAVDHAALSRRFAGGRSRRRDSQQNREGGGDHPQQHTYPRPRAYDGAGSIHGLSDADLPDRLNPPDESPLRIRRRPDGAGAGAEKQSGGGSTEC